MPILTRPLDVLFSVGSEVTFNLDYSCFLHLRASILVRYISELVKGRGATKEPDEFYRVLPLSLSTKRHMICLSETLLLCQLSNPYSPACHGGVGYCFHSQQQKNIDMMEKRLMFLSSWPRAQNLSTTMPPTCTRRLCCS